jgi:hypothetical protein
MHQELRKYYRTWYFPLSMILRLHFFSNIAITIAHAIQQNVYASIDNTHRVATIVCATMALCKHWMMNGEQSYSHLCPVLCLEQDRWAVQGAGNNAQ